MKRLRYKLNDNSFYIQILVVYIISTKYNPIVYGSRGGGGGGGGSGSYPSSSDIHHNYHFNNNNNNNNNNGASSSISSTSNSNIITNINEDNMITNSIFRRISNNNNSGGSGGSSDNSNNNSGISTNNYHSNINDIGILNNNNNNNMLIGLSSCQTVCACKWKGGKQTVECIDRALITIPENIDPSTQVLDMSGNNLQILPYEQFIRANLLNLQKLFLRNCRIGQIDIDAFKGLTNLVELDLSHNLLTSVPSATLSYIPLLRDLTLASNPIQKIEGYSFRNTPSLHKLDLSHCDIQTIAPQAFEGLESLLSLKLNGNKLTELRPRTIETLSRLHGVELHDNPWMCDCRLRMAKIWLTEKNIPYPVAPICSGGPERIIDRTFSDLHIDDFACRPEILPINRFVESTMGDNATIFCRASAIPSPTISWYWNGRLLNNGSAFSSYQRVYIYEDGDREKRSRLILTNSQETDSSEFYCVAENKAGTAEANFTLHVAVRIPGMASLGSGQIVGLSAALVILILFILLITLFLLIRLRRTPFIESKTPNHLEIVTTVNQPNSANNCKQQQVSSTSPQSNGNGMIINNMDGSERKGSFSEGDSKQTNPVQKPPRLTDLPYCNYDYSGNGTGVGGGGGNISNSCFISPTASAGNNPDLINDTKRFGSDEFLDLKIPSVLTNKDCLMLEKPQSVLGGAALAAAVSISSTIERPGSGEYSRAGGCDSLYPSGLWENTSFSSSSTTTAAATQMMHNNYQSDELQHLKHATSTSLTGFNMMMYNDKTPIIDNTQMYDLNMTGSNNSVGSVGVGIGNGITNSEFFSKTFPRTHFGNLTIVSSSSTNGISTSNCGGSSSSIVKDANSTTLTTTTTLSSSSGGGGGGGVSGYPSDYGLPLVPGAEQQFHHHYPLHQQQQQQHPQGHYYQHQQQQQFNNNSSNNNNNNSKTPNSGSSSGSNSVNSSNNTVPTMLPNGMPINAKTIRVWQKGVPVLPPVTALKRALTNSSRNSPDEGYQEGCGTDV